METEEEKALRAMETDFSALTEAHKKRALEMTKFLALTQNVIVPAILSPEPRQPVRRLGAGVEE